MRTGRGGFAFRDVLPRLVAAYEAGRLVPFIGLGMSRPLCADWAGLVHGLEQHAGITAARPATSKTRPEELIRRANLAIARLRHGAPGDFSAGMERALFGPRPAVPPQTAALARTAWPLVVTTNYDNAYIKAYEDISGPGGMAVVGRGPEDCQRVLNSLSTAGRAIVWALQGHLAQPFAVDSQARDRRLAPELVVDHAEYRRVTHREPHFRRAFAEVFRHRSFLFLGSGIRENYLQELFGEVLEIYGPSTRTHFALIPRGEVDPRFMYQRFQIAVIEYPKVNGRHTRSQEMIEELGAAIRRQEAMPVGWSWGGTSTDVRGKAARGDEATRPDFEVIRGPFPIHRGEDECLAVSAGGARQGGAFFLSATDTIRSALAGWGVPSGAQPARADAEGYVGEFEGGHVFAVRARRAKEDLKDLAEIGPASTRLFDLAARRHGCIRMQVLAAGGKEGRLPPMAASGPVNSGGLDPRHDLSAAPVARQAGDTVSPRPQAAAAGEIGPPVPGGAATAQPRWDARAFPARFSFVQTVRRWGLWRRAHPRSRCRLVLHVVDAALARDIASGRIDVPEILRCDDIRFWVEIVDGPGKFERRLFVRRPESTTLGDICEEVGLTPHEWELEVSPPPTMDERDFKHRVLKDKLGHTLDALLLVPGSTLHFRRVLVVGPPGN